MNPPTSPGGALATPAASEDKVAGGICAALNRAVLDQQLELEGGVVTDVGPDKGSVTRGGQRDPSRAGPAEDEGLVAGDGGVGVDPGQVAPIAAGQEAVRLTSAS